MYPLTPSPPAPDACVYPPLGTGPDDVVESRAVVVVDSIDREARDRDRRGVRTRGAMETRVDTEARTTEAVTTTTTEAVTTTRTMGEG